jgi:hypothetical protein
MRVVVNRNMYEGQKPQAVMRRLPEIPSEL